MIVCSFGTVSYINIAFPLSAASAYQPFEIDIEELQEISPRPEQESQMKISLTQSSNRS